jgi:hypothetical protein
MARERGEVDTGAQAQEATNQAAGATPAPPPATVNDDRFKKVKVADGNGGFVVKNRKDYILELWANKWGRGAIAKHLTDLNTTENGGDGKKIPYQIVFAATKGKPGGPDKVVPGQAPASGEGQAA